MKIPIHVKIICPYCGKIEHFKNFGSAFTNGLDFNSECHNCHKIIMEFIFIK